MIQKRTITLTLALAAFALLISGCAGITLDARQSLQEPASCQNTQQEILMLEDNRASGGERVVQGFQGLAPPMIVLSLLRDIYGKPFRSIYLDHWRIAFGSYNKKIDARVQELRACR